MSTNQSKTYFVDIDGTLLEHKEKFQDTLNTEYLPELPNAKEKTSQWHCQGHTIIIVTARCESMRSLTIRQLDSAGIVYDMLIMGITSGPRVLVNDVDPNMPIKKALAYNVIRNVDGLKHVD